MKRKSMKSIIMGAAALAGLAGSGQVASAKATLAQNNTVEYKATADRKASKQKISINNLTGGLNMAMPVRDFGMTPKEYGMRYGNGGSRKSNRLRYSHNAKVKGRTR